MLLNLHGSITGEPTASKFRDPLIVEMPCLHCAEQLRMSNPGTMDSALVFACFPFTYLFGMEERGTSANESLSFDERPPTAKR